MTLLLLVRHAVTAATGTRLIGRAPGYHLSEEGRRQAEALAAHLAPLPLAAVYSSPLERCVETAGAIAAGRSAGVEALPGLAEVDYGRWTDRPFGQLTRTSLWRTVQSRPSGVRFPDGETLAEVQLRAVAALESIAARHPRRVVAAVTHADVIRLALAHYAGVHLDLFQRLVVSPASMTAVAVGEHGPRILRVNDTGTIADLVPRRGRRRTPSPRSPSRPARGGPGRRGGRRGDPSPG